ncbi:MAG: HAMP domain-containing sensor histidine kinase [Ferruginibacter sp.]
MKVQHKIILAFLALTGIILLLSCVLIYNVSDFQRKDDFKNRLKNRATTTASLLFEVEEVNESLLKKVDSVTVNSLYGESIGIYNFNNKLLYRSVKHLRDTIEVNEKIFSSARTKQINFFSVKQKEAMAFSYPTKSGIAVIVISAEDKDGKDRLRQLLFLLLITFVTCLVLSAFAGYIFSRTILNPLNKITHTVKSISLQNIEKRLSESDINDEWNELTKTFNLLLDRLQQSFEIQGRFIANASHELATPLTVITSQIDVTLQQDRNAETYRDTLISVKDDIDQLSQLVKSLLEIARTAKGESIQTRAIRIDELVMDVAASIGKLSFVGKVNLHADALPENEEECTVNGHYDLLLSAFKNIAENGCKYSSDHSVTLSLAFLEEKIIVLFSNKGHIEINDADSLFYPFYRSHSVLHQQGYGMGLSLVQRIIQLHKGEVKVENIGQNEVLFTIVLPSAK